MPKPNSSMTVSQMKAYIRQHKVNHPEVKLGMKRGDMIAGLKKAGHWDNSESKTRPPKTKKPAKKAVPKGSHRMPDGTIMKDSAMPKKAPAKKAPAKNKSPQRQETTKKKEVKKAPAKGTTTDALFNLPFDVGGMILAESKKIQAPKVGEEIYLGKKIADAFGKLYVFEDVGVYENSKMEIGDVIDVDVEGLLSAETRKKGLYYEGLKDNADGTGAFMVARVMIDEIKRNKKGMLTATRKAYFRGHDIDPKSKERNTLFAY